MQQYFITEIQKKYTFDPSIHQLIMSDQFVNLLQQIGLPELDQLIPQLCIMIQECKDNKLWIYLGLAIKQLNILVRNSTIAMEQYLKLCLKTYVQLIQLLNNDNYPEQLEFILGAFYSLADRVDNQFWMISAWYFRNSSQNLQQLELLRVLLLSFDNKPEFIDILELKLRIEINNADNVTNQMALKLILKSLKRLLELNNLNLIDQGLFRFLIKCQQNNTIIEEYYQILQIIDFKFEKQHLLTQQQNNNFITYQQFTANIVVNFIDNNIRPNLGKQISSDQHINIIKVLTKYCQNPVILEIFYEYSFMLLQHIYEQVLYYSMNIVYYDDLMQETLDLMTKVQSDSKICAFSRLFLQLNTYCKQFTQLSYEFLKSTLINILKPQFLEEPPKRGKIIFQLPQNQTNLITNYINQTTQITFQSLKPTLILLCIMKPLLVNAHHLTNNIKSLLECCLTPLVCQTGDVHYKAILTLFLHKYFKQLFKDDSDDQTQHDFVAYLLNQIILANHDSTISITVLNLITKSKSSYRMLKNVIHNNLQSLTYLIYNCQDIDFFISLQNLAKYHSDILERICEPSLLKIQERILKEVNNNNKHAVIKLLQTYAKLLKVLLSETVFNLNINFVELFQLFRLAKQLNIEDEMIVISKIYFSATQCQDIQLISQVSYCIIEIMSYSAINLNCFKYFERLTDYGTRLITDEMPQLLNIIVEKCIEQIVMNRVTVIQKQILTNIMRNGQLNINQIVQILNTLLGQLQQDSQNELSVELICAVCAYNLESTENFHLKVLEIIKQNYQQSQTQTQEIYISEAYFLISLFVYYQENYGKCQIEMEYNIFILLINILHAYLIIVDQIAVDQEKEYNKKKVNKHQQITNDVFEDFQNMVSRTQQKIIKIYENQMSQLQYFKYQQLLTARTQLGLATILYDRFQH